MLALLGVFAIEDENREKMFAAQQLQLVSQIVKVGLDYFEDSKLVKTTVGCLTNFSVQESVRQELSKEKDFYVLIYNIVE